MASAIVCLQTAQHQVHEVLSHSEADTGEETKSYYATVADAVTSAGTAIGQLSNQVFGGSQVRRLASITFKVCVENTVRDVGSQVLMLNVAQKLVCRCSRK